MVRHGVEQGPALSFSRLRARLRNGIALGPFVVSVRRRRAREANAVSVGALKRHVERIGELVPEVREVVGPILTGEPTSVEAALAFANGYVALHHDAAREVQLRNLLTRLRLAVESSSARAHIDLLIAESDLRSGVVDRAAPLRTRPADDPARREFERGAREADRRYGAPVIELREAWAQLPGDVRGRSLLLLLETFREDFRDTAVLHVAPEEEVRRWFAAHGAELRADYRTLDAFSVTEDIQGDVTRLELGDSSFDHVICHRVLEHVLDDAAALREIHRVLRPGGVLQVSVPQSMQLDATNEWIVQDESHHGHVRQYGADFEERLAAAGFDVELSRVLLDRAVETHLAEGTFPLRVYLCRRK